MYNSRVLLYKIKVYLPHLSWNMAILFHLQVVFSLACGSLKYSMATFTLEITRHIPL